MNRTLRILQDGKRRHQRVHAYVVEQIRAEVEAEFAGQLATATFWQQIKLRRQIRQEIARRLPKPPSLDNLYVKLP